MPRSSVMILSGKYPPFRPSAHDIIPYVDDSIPYLMDDPPLSLAPSNASGQKERVISKAGKNNTMDKGNAQNQILNNTDTISNIDYTSTITGDERNCSNIEDSLRGKSKTNHSKVVLKQNDSMMPQGNVYVVFATKTHP